jgi:hypothetical protein
MASTVPALDMLQSLSSACNRASSAASSDMAPTTKV